MGQLTQNFVDLAMATCKEGRHPSLTVWEAQQLLHAWNDREALRARVAKQAALLADLRAAIDSGDRFSYVSGPLRALLDAAIGGAGNKTAASNEVPK